MKKHKVDDGLFETVRYEAESAEEEAELIAFPPLTDFRPEVIIPQLFKTAAVLLGSKATWCDGDRACAARLYALCEKYTPGDEWTAFKIGEAYAELKMRIKAYPVLKHRANVSRNRKNSEKAARQSAEKRAIDHDDFIVEVQELYRETRGKSKRERIKRLLALHGDQLRRDHPSAGLSERNLYSIIK